MNIVENILFNHSVEPVKDVSPGDIVTVNVDRVIMVDMAALHPEFLDNPPVKPFDPEKISLVFDHYVPAPNIEIANRVNRLRKVVDRWGIKDFYDVGRGGISHVLGGEKGWFRPGSLIANTDSHTIATGAFNTLGHRGQVQRRDNPYILFHSYTVLKFYPLGILQIRHSPRHTL